MGRCCVSTCSPQGPCAAQSYTSSPNAVLRARFLLAEKLRSLFLLLVSPKGLKSSYNHLENEALN